MTTTDPHPAPLSDYLRAAVAASGLSAYAVAQAAGVSTQVVSRWLKRDRDLTLATADKIAAGLGLSPAGKISGKKQ